MKLEEGKNYLFRVSKTTWFEGEEYLVLSGPSGVRFMMLADRYKSYNIDIGSEITCRIDKINCKGEVFLEPQHPYYKEGSVYQFEIIGNDIRIDRVGNKHNVFIVVDWNNNEVSVPESLLEGSTSKVGMKVDLKVERISKGRILFTGMVEAKRSEKEEGLTIYDFRVIEEVKGLDGRLYYLVSDADLTKYTVPSEYYRHYGIVPGIEFKGRFIKYKAGEEVRIEPINPFFNPGDIYPFIVEDIVELTTGRGVITLVSDSHGHTHKVDGDLGLKKGDPVNLIVERIRKGWPLLRQL
jgi:hypothetical protein